MFPPKNIGYHTRLVSDGTKVTGGSFGGAIDMETVNRLVRAHFEVAIKPSGRGVFVDKQGREVWLYLGIDATRTEKGKVAYKAWQDQCAAEAEAEEELREVHEAEIAQAMDGLSHAEILARLRGDPLRPRFEARLTLQRPVQGFALPAF